MKPIFKHNEMMGRHDVELPYTVGSLTSATNVATIDDNVITFYKPLTIDDVVDIIMEWKTTEHYLKNQVVSPSVDR